MSNSSTNLRIPEIGHFLKLHREEDGMVTWSVLVAILFLLCFSGLVYNSGNTVNRKLATQNAADAAAYSGSLWIARGMNALTASNHLIGELDAIYVLHHALAGRWMDDRGRVQNHLPELVRLNATLQGTYTAVPPGATPPALGFQFKKVKEDPSADRNSMIYEAKLRLKRIMWKAYVGHAIGFGLSKFPPTAPAGYAIMVMAFAVECKVYQEYLVLDGLELVAAGLRGPKKTIPGIIHRGVYQGYQRLMLIANVPRLAINAAESVAQEQGAKGVIHGDLPDALPGGMLEAIQQGAKFFPLLPVEAETTRNETRSQLIRATYPWVLFWRTPIRRFLSRTCTLSGASSSYARWTNRYTLQSCEWLRRPTSSSYRKELTIANFSYGGGGPGERGKEVRLYVVSGLNATPGGFTKSRELWNNWRRRSDATSLIEKLFCHVGFARQQPPVIRAGRFFRQENPHGIVCFAQSMIYNANPQQRPAAAGSQQAQVGWDTLNWTGNAPEFPVSLQDESGQSSPPTIKLNWQAKLTPVTPQKLARVLPKAAIDESTRSVLAATREGLILTSH